MKKSLALLLALALIFAFPVTASAAETSLPVPALAGKLGMAVAHRNGSDADQPRCADERQPL